MDTTIGNTRIEVVQGDIITQEVDAIVNAANNTLLGGGGVDGAIHKAGGPAILEACSKLGGCDNGEAKITTAGNLSAKFVIHTVGPVYHDGSYGEAEYLRSCYWRSLEVALENKVESMAFPAISCGAYGYPIPEAAEIALNAVKQFCESQEGIGLIRFVLYGEETYNAFRNALAQL